MLKITNLPSPEVIAQIIANEAEQTAVETVLVDMEAELVWLDATIPTIGTMTNVQVRDVVKRLAQENRGVIRSLVWLARKAL